MLQILHLGLPSSLESALRGYLLGHPYYLGKVEEFKRVHHGVCFEATLQIKQGLGFSTLTPEVQITSAYLVGLATFSAYQKLRFTLS